eukprot:CAMPEP_0179896614 /NCGR_PEP_ID=MMETSP0982-20121206/36515_1 /TAXON_ID=483367 /ORGANISM="non described non described, Strain CCMP 2436" /LENGTH=198 /DNA_ID=CAMNT_0021793487 /DNA_START=233 /DNA_END=827 /DNA_ORIENTATION=-
MLRILRRRELYTLQSPADLTLVAGRGGHKRLCDCGDLIGAKAEERREDGEVVLGDHAHQQNHRDDRGRPLPQTGLLVAHRVDCALEQEQVGEPGGRADAEAEERVQVAERKLASRANRAEKELVAEHPPLLLAVLVVPPFPLLLRARVQELHPRRGWRKLGLDVGLAPAHRVRRAIFERHARERPAAAGRRPALQVPP